ncbi:hypothetical protein BLA29_006483 [Euroglyphus maynei]|uniref:Cation-transporting ATPase-like protein n=1 Tax=Euroglyphus maynei TaxID=6958 RepID=A0A1Y3BSK9_EURMA|nr:hypothetical protein BLA29_006483 [Euroglyphus maynei]
MSRKGARVLALGRKNLGNISSGQIRNFTREDVETELDFVGFLIISCPLKPDSVSVMKEIIASSHYVTMITGDAPLTACHVAKELYFVSSKKPTLILHGMDKLTWKSIDETVCLPLIPDNKEFFRQYEFCVTGDSLNALLDCDPKFFVKMLPKIRVFARVAPKQKEFIITSLRSLGYTTLMCGDGTNDVGALKHAHVGVALLSNPLPIPIPKTEKSPNNNTVANNNGDHRRSINDVLAERNNNRMVNNHQHHKQRRNHAHNNNPASVNPRVVRTQERINQLLKELEEQDKAQIVKLGDASIAAPFTSKLSSIQCSKYF